ncbi:hypothetical protein Csa_000924 [Cucumis sativus]|uniref:Uncharacterized protein n=1 Tax=Cucumis sativus TaxID=3659 RepID=A0A0A0LIX4_CUCSA|nr:hypothetical protein Csa_000924 [Cucumis sativus]
MYKSPFFSLSLNDAVGGVKFRTAPPSLNPMEKLKHRKIESVGQKVSDYSRASESGTEAAAPPICSGNNRREKERYGDKDSEHEILLKEKGIEFHN